MFVSGIGSDLIELRQILKVFRLWLGKCNKIIIRAVVVAQLVEWSLPIPEVRGLNPVIGKKIIYILNICLLSTVYWKDENKEKEAGNGPFKKK